MKKPQCSKCLYSREARQADKLICKFNPPTTIPIISKNGVVVLYTNYAIVNANDSGCWQYKEK